MTITHLGGNIYQVNEGTAETIVDLDGFTCVTDDDYEELEERGIDTSLFIAPMHCDEEEEKQAVEYAARRTAFDISTYTISTNQ